MMRNLLALGQFCTVAVFLAILAAGVAGAVPWALLPAPAGSDPQAIALADQVMEALGGRSAWDNTHFLRFDFAGRRTHWWDKWTGRHRVEGKTKEGETYVVLENVNTREGKAYLNGQEAAGERAKQLLELGYATWINDVYWLAMPYKMRDPGVTLHYLGEETIDGTLYDKVQLTFDHVGLTPGDTYWAFINRGTHLMDRWAYLLEDEPRDKAPTGWLWQGWQRYGKILLAPHRVQVGGDRKIELDNIAVFDRLPDSVFTSVSPAY